MTRSAGYTLMELIIAMSLATFVVVGVMMVSGVATRFSIVGSTRADAASWSLVALNQMSRDIENASYIKGSILPGDTLSACQNYSVTQGSVIESGSAVVSFYYCVAAVGGVQSLLRYVGASCPISPTPTCGSTGGFSVVAKNVHTKNEGGASPNTPDYFQFSADNANAVEVHFVVGVATGNYTSVPAGSGLNTPTPQAIRVDTVIGTNIPWNNTADLQ